MEYKDFVPQNVALSNTRRIGIYDGNGNRVGFIPLGSLTPPNVAQKQYSFGALSDVHLQNTSAFAPADFEKALKYLNESEAVDFICVAGDLTEAGTATELAQYKQYIDTYSPTTPVYEITGNHDGRSQSIATDFQAYTGKPLYYSFEHNGDVFIMVGCQPAKTAGGWPESGSLFTVAELQWLYEILEANRNKRCFVFEHANPDDACGNALGIYKTDIWGGNEQKVFESLLRHYKNTIMFHGHSHLKFDMQQYSDLANIDNVFGCWTVHIPSISVPRGTSSAVNPSLVELYAESEGYVVDVYENGIHLRGRDFVKGEFLPIASYWLDTTLQNIPAGTYTDSTGTIKK